MRVKPTENNFRVKLPMAADVEINTKIKWFIEKLAKMSGRTKADTIEMLIMRGLRYEDPEDPDRFIGNTETLCLILNDEAEREARSEQIAREAELDRQQRSAP